MRAYLAPVLIGCAVGATLGALGTWLWVAKWMGEER